MTDDGQEIIFTTSEALSSDDGNGAPDIYLWKNGHTSLISTGSVGGGASSGGHRRIRQEHLLRKRPAAHARKTPTASKTYTTPASTAGSASPRSKTAPVKPVSRRNRVAQPAPAPATDQGPNGSGNYKRATVSMKALSSSQRKTLAAGGKVRLGVRVSGAGKISVEGTTSVHKKVVQVVSATSRAVQPGLVSLPISLSQECPLAASKRAAR